MLFLDRLEAYPTLEVGGSMSQAALEVMSRYPLEWLRGGVIPWHAGGLSGAELWLVRGGDGTERVLRRWPEAARPDRLAWIHRVLWRAANVGIDFIPAPLELQTSNAAATGETIVYFEGRCWELAPRMPGKPSYAQSPSAAKRGAAMEALAKFHRAVESEPSDQGGWGKADRRRPSIALEDSSASPGLIERAALCKRLLGGEIGEIAAGVAAFRHARWLSIFEQRGISLARLFAAASREIPSISSGLGRGQSLSFHLQPCIRDVWHEHILFAEQRTDESNAAEKVTGLVDFGAMRLDTVAADVARLLGGMAEDDRDAWQAGLAAYEAVRPLSDDERTAAPIFDASGVILGAINWLRWLCVEGREFADENRVAQRLSYFERRLKN